MPPIEGENINDSSIFPALYVEMNASLLDIESAGIDGLGQIERPVRVTQMTEYKPRCA